VLTDPRISRGLEESEVLNAVHEMKRQVRFKSNGGEEPRAFAWSGDAKKLSSNDSFGKNVAKYSKLGQSERFLLHWVGLGTL
jgi:hypothetical protein